MCGFLVDSGSELESKQIEEAFKSLVHRGPDSTIVKPYKDLKFYFHRLAIMDPGESGDQPFEDAQAIMVCNGEIYNYKELKEDVEDYPYKGKSDCEVILPLFFKWGIEKLCVHLDAEFSFCLYDKKSKKLFVARDAIGIRPLFYGKAKNGKFLFASEVKSLVSLCDRVDTFPPGHYWSEESGFVLYKDITKIQHDYIRDEKKALKGIREKLIEGVRKRLMSDVPGGFLLSGGLDSSLVCAIATQVLKKPITTFAVGMTEGPIDTKYARQVADYIKSDHHEYLFTFDEVLNSLDDVIYHLESFDITTIRASIGMYLLCKYIKRSTDIKVLLTGEVSDELFGYKYTDFAPNPEEFQKESQKRVQELYLYDVLRSDRCISAHSLEARVPFGDHDFASFVTHIDPKLKMNSTGVGKYLLRAAFSEDDLLPRDILFREKAAFSDAVGHSMVDLLKEHAETKYSDKEFANLSKLYNHCRPHTKEALWYREIFEKYFKGQSHLIPGMWMPNKDWDHCDVTDPSARALPNYGKSGQ